MQHPVRDLCTDSVLQNWGKPICCPYESGVKSCTWRSGKGGDCNAQVRTLENVICALTDRFSATLAKSLLLGPRGVVDGTSTEIQRSAVEGARSVLCIRHCIHAPMH